MTNCFFCRKQFQNLDSSHLHAFGLNSNALPACPNMNLQIIVDLDRNDRWFSR